MNGTDQSACVRVQVENLAEDGPLEELQERFKFLGRLNQYHSSVEDEVRQECGCV